MIKAGIKNIVFSSSCAVYKERELMPVTERSKILPKSPYGISKFESENIIKKYCDLFGLRYLILRYFNVCGASDDGRFGDSRKPQNAVVQNAVRAALKIAPFCLTYSRCKTLDRSPIRDFINVVDLNEVHHRALGYILNHGKSEILNLGTGKGNSVLEIVNLVKEITQVDFLTKKTTPREGEYPIMIASIKKAEKILGWKPKRTIKDSIISMITWYNNNPYGWDT